MVTTVANFTFISLLEPAQKTHKQTMITSLIRDTSSLTRTPENPTVLTTV